MTCQSKFWDNNLWCIAWNFGFDQFVDVRLYVATLIGVCHTRELIVTDHIRCIDEACLRIFNICSIFSLITSCFQLRNFYRWSVARNFCDHFLIEVSSNTLFLSSLTCISVVFDFFRTCQSWVVFNKFFTSFFIYVKCDLNFFRLTFRSITRNFMFNQFVNVSLNSSIFSCFSAACKLIIFTNH